jgi:hypothetical protein
MEKRLKGLYTAWSLIYQDPKIKYKQMFTFNRAIAVKVVTHYAKDLDFLKLRYNIPNKVQPPKIAGLMVNAVLKYRPLVPKEGGQIDIEQNEVNEFLALYCGLSVCAKYSQGGIGVLNGLILRPSFKIWLRRFIFLLRERNYTSESLIMAFETLCWASFPDAMVDASHHG